MNRYVLMPEIDPKNKHGKVLTRVFYSVVLTSVEFFLAILAVIVGIPVVLDPFGLTFALAPGSLVQLLPLWMVDFWAAQMVGGGIITMTGIIRGDFRIEQIGVVLLMAGAFVYSMALTTILPGSFVAMTTYILFTLAMGGRYWVLGRLIKLTGRLVRKHNQVEE